MTLLKQPMRLLDEQGCVRCPKLVTSRRRIVHGYGDAAARIVFIGEAPGRHGADRTGVPFTSDRSGIRLQRMLIELGLATPTQPSESLRLRCFITNVVRCCPPNNRTPTPSEVDNCAPFLAHELDAIDPRIIVPVGRPALRAVGLRYLGRDPGAIRTAHAIPIVAGERVIVPLVHPARISNAQIEGFVAVMRRVLDVQAGTGNREQGTEKLTDN
jgi:DNA polymerase